jgi:DNA (cytosine-5)-methyltransferase 1
MNLDSPAPTLPAIMGGNRTPIVDQLQLETEAAPWVVEYHRHLQAGGEPVDVIPDRLRRITVEEAAAIQTFPDWIEWQGPSSAIYRQIGNAVPPMLAYFVAQAVRAAIGLGQFAALEDPQPRQLALATA